VELARARPAARAVRRAPALVHDPSADAVVIVFGDEPVGWSRQLDPDRRIDYGEDGGVVAVAFERVSWGVELRDLPSRALVGRLLAEHCVKTIA
jgi:uncharacterized protein YuzE